MRNMFWGMQLEAAGMLRCDCSEWQRYEKQRQETKITLWLSTAEFSHMSRMTVLTAMITHTTSRKSCLFC